MRLPTWYRRRSTDTPSTRRSLTPSPPPSPPSPSTISSLSSAFFPSLRLTSTSTSSTTTTSTSTSSTTTTTTSAASTSIEQHSLPFHDDNDWPAGTLVTITGLTHRADLNGLPAILTAPEANDGRVSVTVLLPNFRRVHMRLPPQNIHESTDDDITSSPITVVIASASPPPPSSSVSNKDNTATADTTPASQRTSGDGDAAGIALANLLRTAARSPADGVRQAAGCLQERSVTLADLHAHAERAGLVRHPTGFCNRLGVNLVCLARPTAPRMPHSHTGKNPSSVSSASSSRNALAMHMTREARSGRTSHAIHGEAILFALDTHGTPIDLQARELLRLAVFTREARRVVANLRAARRHRVATESLKPRWDSRAERGEVAMEESAEEDKDVENACRTFADCWPYFRPGCALSPHGFTGSVCMTRRWDGGFVMQPEDLQPVA